MLRPDEVIAQDCTRCEATAGKACRGSVRFHPERIVLARHAAAMRDSSPLDFEATITRRTYVDGMDVTDLLNEGAQDDDGR